ncbi:MAG: undecaprenyldiphospho-muramoylpentapeptide beta-N-acetylglucosaminyltransferase [Deltaproteobacteria bacterium]|nr:undecaprenyldiphospho-muramoylpentapeptide beta-N-acetylglucosaminyltransferase [Deltaproteobacteria bacterium]
MSALGSIVIAGGGTGGHVFPGVAVAEEVRRRNPDARVAFVGTTRGLEARVIPSLGFPLETIKVSRLKGGGLWDKVKGLFLLPIAIFQSWRILRRWKPDVVLGVGGYASGPMLIASWLTWRKTAIQEQNATPGMTNRWLGKLVKRVLVGFVGAERHFKAKKTITTGNPIRLALAERLTAGRRTAEQQSPAAAREGFSVLVFGGSQGASFLNERLPPALVAFDARHPGAALRVVHQTGTKEVEATAARYAGTPLAGRVSVVPFIDDMPRAYAAADVAMCRAGALTIAELTAVGLPSLLVPFPFAADNHQEANARVLEAAGAALVQTQATWDEAVVARWLDAVATDGATRAAMAKAAASLGRVDATARVVDALEELAR